MVDLQRDFQGVRDEEGNERERERERERAASPQDYEILVKCHV